MTPQSRRHFLRRLAITAPALIGARAFAEDTAPAVPATPAETPTPVELTEDDPVAMALGYKKDHTQVDATKYPMYKPENVCEKCALYTGKPSEPMGPCAIFQNKLVTANGWCVSFAPKPPANPNQPTDASGDSAAPADDKASPNAPKAPAPATAE